jgi:C1A family cysteine protease
MYKIGGYLPSEGDLNVSVFKSNETLNNLASATPADGYIIPDYSPILNQSSLSSCVANAACGSLELLKGLEDPNSIQLLSRLFVYYNARAYDNAINEDKGCYIHNALNSLTKFGVCEENLWPYDITQVFYEPSLLAYKEGNDNMITTFYQIISEGNELINDIVLALKSVHPVIFGTKVGTDFEAYFNGDLNKVFDPTTSPVGGHAMIIVGFRTNISGEKEFLIRNSWGTSFGINGKCWFSSKYITWNETGDFFVPTRMDNLLI